jgi:hypothetical protein
MQRFADNARVDPGSDTMKVLTLALTLVLAAASTALACPDSFRRLEILSPAHSPMLATADGTAVAWSTAAVDPSRTLVTGRLVVREGTRDRTIFESRTSRRGRVLGPDGRELDANYDVFCAVDWSSDGRYLIVQEVIGTWPSNAFDDLYWVWDRTRERRAMLDVAPLLHAVAIHWKARGAPVVTGEYTVEPVGWHAGEPDRVVFAASTTFTTDDRFLGLWSVGLRGEKPRLLSETQKRGIIRPWGRDRPT